VDSQPLPTELVIPHGDAELICRLPALRDVPAIVEACQDPEIPRWTRVPTPYGIEQGRGFVEFSLSSWGDRRGLELLMTPGEGHPLAHLPLLGACDARLDWAGEQASAGYWIHAEARRHGVAKAALGGICRWLLDLGFKRVEAAVLVGNVGSCRTLESVGFQLEGTRRSLAAGHCGVGADRHDQHTFGLLPDEFLDPASGRLSG